MFLSTPRGGPESRPRVRPTDVPDAPVYAPEGEAPYPMVDGPWMPYPYPYTAPPAGYEPVYEPDFFPFPVAAAPSGRAPLRRRGWRGGPRAHDVPSRDAYGGPEPMAFPQEMPMEAPAGLEEVPVTLPIPAPIDFVPAPDSPPRPRPRPRCPPRPPRAPPAGVNSTSDSPVPAPTVNLDESVVPQGPAPVPIEFGEFPVPVSGSNTVQQSVVSRSSLSSDLYLLAFQVADWHEYSACGQSVLYCAVGAYSVACALLQL